MNEKPTIIIDTREKAPWAFSSRVLVERRRLDAGDYSAVGHESRVLIERKSLPDLVRTLISEKARFRKEIRKLAAVPTAAIIVDATPEDLIRGQYRQDVDPRAVAAAIASIHVVYRIPTIWGGSRAGSAYIAEEIIVAAVRRHQAA